MSNCSDIHLNDIGTILEFAIVEYIDGVKTPVDLSAQTSITVSLQKPDLSVVDRAAYVEGLATAGIVRYITQPGDIDQTGDWKAQVVIDFDTGGHFASSIIDFRVTKNLS